jgi:hypothetical protein
MDNNIRVNEDNSEFELSVQCAQRQQSYTDLTDSPCQISVAKPGTTVIDLVSSSTKTMTFSCVFSYRIRTDIRLFVMPFFTYIPCSFWFCI